MKTEGGANQTTRQGSETGRERYGQAKGTEHPSTKGKIYSYQGYDYQGENLNIRVILALKMRNLAIKLSSQSSLTK